MRQRLISGVLYCVTAIAQLGFLDFVDGMGGPRAGYRFILDFFTAGTVCFALAAAFSLFNRRIGTYLAFAATSLSIPTFVLELPAVPWSDVLWFVRYRTETVFFIITFIAASAYSLRMAYISLRTSQNPPTN